jgi:excisionase family DNA binding protein
MKRSDHTESFQNQTDQQSAAQAPPTTYPDLPNRLLTAFEVAEFVGCHEETVRRAYLRGLLTSQRFGVRGRRFHPTDVMDWIRRGAPTRVS